MWITGFGPLGPSSIDSVHRDPPPPDDSDWYFENITYFAEPGRDRRAPGPMERWQGWWQRNAERLADADPVAALAARQGFVLTTYEARALGVTRAQARTYVGTSAWQFPCPGVLAPIDVRDDDRWRVERRRHALASSAAALRNRGHVVSGRSAAVLHGLPTFVSADLPVLTADPHTTLGRRGAVHARGAGHDPDEVTDWFGAAILTIACTIVDLARHDRRDAIVAADAALHEGFVTIAALHEGVDRARGWPGVAQARAVLALASPLAESPLESIVRLALHDDGFPPPQLQVVIPVPGQRRPYRVDFLWPAQRLILEADGLGKYVGDALRREKKREVALRRASGYRIERVVWADVVDSWPETRELLWPYFG